MTLAKMQVRRGTAAEWTAADPVLAEGEPGYDTTADQLRIGDGTTAWSSLPVLAPSAAGGGGAVQSYAGKNAVGGTLTAFTDRQILFQKITLATAALVTDVECYVDPNNSGQVQGAAAGICRDNAGVPGELLAVNQLPSQSLYLAAQTTPRWLAVAMGRYLTAGTYWLAWQHRRAAATTLWRYAYDTTGGTGYALTAGGDWLQDGAGAAATGRDYSIRANLIR